MDVAENQNKRSVRQIDKQKIPLHRPVTTWMLGENILEVVSMERKSDSLSKFRKISKENYVDLETGEILDYKLNTSRDENINSMRKTLHKIRRTINNNFSGGENELFITLTYADNMMDVKKLYNDFKHFWTNIKNSFPQYTGLEYINIIEPQGRGAWHCHVLIKCDAGQKLYMPNDIVYSAWCRKGWTKTKRLKGVDNIGAYLSAYLTDVEINKENVENLLQTLGENAFSGRGCEIIAKDVIDDDGNTVSKQFIKGARLRLYPSGLNIIRCSRGIVKPISEELPYFEVKEKVGSRTPDYQRSIAIMNSVLEADGEQPLNVITYENYNLKRSICK